MRFDKQNIMQVNLHFHFVAKKQTNLFEMRFDDKNKVLKFMHPIKIKVKDDFFTEV